MFILHVDFQNYFKTFLFYLQELIVELCNIETMYNVDHFGINQLCLSDMNMVMSVSSCMSTYTIYLLHLLYLIMFISRTQGSKYKETSWGRAVPSSFQAVLDN